VEHVSLHPATARETAVPDGVTAIPPAAVALVGELEEALWAQREALEQLCYRLASCKLVLGAAEHRFVGRSTSEADRAARRVQAVRDDVARLTARTAAAFDLPHGELEDLAVRCPEPRRSILSDHAHTIDVLAREAALRSADVQRLLATGSAEVAALVAPLTGEIAPQGYTAEGRAAEAGIAARRFDGVA
jgi:hypothetical protein